MDNLVFEESLATEVEQSEFISKKYVYVNDNNAQNYTSQVVIDSTPLSNAGGYVNWSEGYIIVPMVVQLTSATAGSLPMDNTEWSDYTWAFKNGFWNIINSMTVEFNNQNIIQQTPFINVFRTFKALTSWSKDDVANHGAETGFYVDNAGSWTYHATASTDVGNITITEPEATNGFNVGIANNRDAPTMTSSGLGSGTIAIPAVDGTGNVLQLAGNVNTSLANIASTFNTANIALTSGVLKCNANEFIGNPYAYNDGFLVRQGVSGYDAVANISTTTSIIAGSQRLVNPTATSTTVYRSQKVQTQNGSVIWKVTMKLRLKDLNDYFEKTPLLKGSTMRFYINTNQSSVVFRKIGGVVNSNGKVTKKPTMEILSSTVTGGLTQPLMVASPDFQQGCASLPVDTYTLTCSIFKNQNQSQTINNYTLGQHDLSACRLYAPVYYFNPIAESRYLSLAPTKKISYRDVFQYQFNSIGKGSNFNFLVTNGINNIKSVLVVPYVSKSQDGGVNLAVSSPLNPCSPAPAIPDPITLTNFNVLVSGVNLFLNNELYDFEAFSQQLAQSNHLYGCITT